MEIERLTAGDVLAAVALSPATLPAAGFSPEKRVRAFPAMDRAWVWPGVLSETRQTHLCSKEGGSGHG